MYHTALIPISEGVIFRHQNLTSEDGPPTKRIKKNIIGIDPLNRYEGIGMRQKELTETFIKNRKKKFSVARGQYFLFK